MFARNINLSKIFLITSCILRLVWSDPIQNTRRLNHENTSQNNNDSNSTPSFLRRRLQHKPYYYWYSDKPELMETTNGKVPTLSCPLGTYREFGNEYLRKPGGLRLDGCLKCPKGRYGSSIDLKSSLCTAPCPRGTYRDKAGGKSIDDCTPCPAGTYGDKEGLTTKQCSGSCTGLNTRERKYYSNLKGLTTRKDCKVCPKGYRGWQCDWPMYSPNESDHHYENGNEMKSDDEKH